MDDAFVKTESEREKPLGAEELVAFCDEMSLYLHAGNPVSECFYIFLKEPPSFLPRAAIVELYSETEMGTSLREAMDLTGLFPSHVLSMVDAGERTGHLEDVFAGLSEYYSARIRTRREVKSAVGYPLILLAVTLAVVFIVLPQVLPIYNEAFAALGGTMPAFTFLIVRAAEGLKSAQWYIIGLFALIIILALAAAFIPSRREAFTRRARASFYKTAAGRALMRSFFASLLSLGVSGGLGMDETLGMIEKSFADRFGPETIRAVREAVAAGKALPDAVREAALLSPVDCSLLSAGLATGSVEKVLLQIVRRAEDDASETLSRTIGRIEPAIVLIMSVIVAVVLLAVMLPLLGVLSVIS